MDIKIKKQIDKQSVITITRNDKTSTWSKLHNGMETHDIAHFAVESVLNFQHAFYGIINMGYSIQDFVLPRDQRPFEVRPENLHHEALITEHIVNLLETETLNSKSENFIETLRTILSENELLFPEHLSQEKLDEIRALYLKLCNKWWSLNDGDELQINFTP